MAALLAGAVHDYSSVMLSRSKTDGLSISEIVGTLFGEAIENTLCRLLTNRSSDFL